MKRILMLSAVLFLFSHSTSFAHQFYLGQLLNHKESASPGVRGSAKMVAYKPPRLKTPAQENFNELIDAHTYLDETELKLGENRISGTAHVAITNPGFSPQSYTITTTVCISPNGPMGLESCYSVDDQVELNSKGHIQYGMHPTLIYQLTDPHFSYVAFMTVSVKNNNTLAIYQTGNDSYLGYITQ